MCLESHQRVTIPLSQGMEIVQTMNSDPGLAVGEEFSFSLWEIITPRSFDQPLPNDSIHCFL